MVIVATEDAAAEVTVKAVAIVITVREAIVATMAIEGTKVTVEVAIGAMIEAAVIVVNTHQGLVTITPGGAIKRLLARFRAMKNTKYHRLRNGLKETRKAEAVTKKVIVNITPIIKEGTTIESKGKLRAIKTTNLIAEVSVEEAGIAADSKTTLMTQKIKIRTPSTKTTREATVAIEADNKTLRNQT